MNEPTIKKFPTEIFGYPFSGQSDDFKKAINDQCCFYIDGTCKNPAKVNQQPKWVFVASDIEGILVTHLSRLLFVLTD